MNVLMASVLSVDTVTLAEIVLMQGFVRIADQLLVVDGLPLVQLQMAVLYLHLSHSVPVTTAAAGQNCTPVVTCAAALVHSTPPGRLYGHSTGHRLPWETRNLQRRG